MTTEPEATLQQSLDAIDHMRRRIYLAGLLVVGGTLAAYGRLAYLHSTTDNLEKLLGASVLALTSLVAWATFALVLVLTRTTKRLLHAIALVSRRQ